MSREKGRSKATLGDSALDFMAQWKASRPEEPSAVIEPDQGSIGGNRNIEQTLRSWKQGGSEVKVKRGISSGFEKRRPKAGGAPLGRRGVAPISGPGNLRPARPPVPQPPPAPPPKCLRQRLLEASADVRDLQIAAAMSCPRDFMDLDPVVEVKEGKLAILGLDFGTAFTKAVVRWSGRHYAVDWSDAVEGEDVHLLASVFSEGQDGRCTLGAQEGPGWRVHEGIKLQLLSSGATTTGVPMVDAVIFIALAFRYVNAWLASTNQEASKGIRWRLHVGLPTRSWDSDATTETFKSVAQAARVLAFMRGPVTRTAAQEALLATGQVDRPAVDVFPEFACQLYSYLLSSERREDLHALVDIGAGTLDVAYFNVFVKDGEPLLPIFASEVEKLGAHYLIAALCGVAGNPVWTDGESSLSDEEVAQKQECSSNDVSRRRSLYLSSVAEVFNMATCEAKKTYPTSPAVQGKEIVRLFLCGGGSRIPSLQKLFDRIAREAEPIMGIKFQVSELVRPRDIVGKLDSGFDRLSVAYGLSQNAANIGCVMRSASLEPVLSRVRVDKKDRDDDR